MTVPAEKARQLIAKINTMIALDNREECLDGIESEISAIERSGCVYQAWLLQGMIAGLRGDAETVHRKFQAALRASGNELIVLINYAQALSNLCDLREAVEKIDEIVVYAPDDVSVLEMALSIHEESFDVDGAEKIIERLNRLGLGNRVDPQTKGKLMYLRSEMSKTDVAWADVASRIELVTDVLQSMGVFSGVSSQFAVEDGVHMEFAVRGDMETVCRAENAILNAIASQEYSSADRFISFGCALR